MTIEYFYDDNGNMIHDNNKSIDIEYNYLNLPYIIDFGNGNKIFYKYDANGNKLQKTVFSTGMMSLAKDYSGIFVYDNNTQGDGTNLEFIINPKGRIIPLTAGTFNYEYYLKDHLGNNRVSFTDNNGDGNAEVVQESHFYPFGMTMGGINYNSGAGSSTNKYLFQGQELQDNHNLGLYQFKWRFYDPNMARFVSVDPLADKYPWNSTYAFAENKVIRYMELEGTEIVDPFDYLSDKAGQYLEKKTYELASSMIELAANYVNNKYEEIKTDFRENNKALSVTGDARLNIGLRATENFNVSGYGEGIDVNIASICLGGVSTEIRFDKNGLNANTQSEYIGSPLGTIITHNVRGTLGYASGGLGYESRSNPNLYGTMEDKLNYYLNFGGASVQQEQISTNSTNKTITKEGFNVSFSIGFVLSIDISAGANLETIEER